MSIPLCCQEIAPLPSLSLLCWFVPSPLFLVFQVETGIMEEEGIANFQRFYELCLWHVWSVASPLDFEASKDRVPTTCLGPGCCPRAGPLSQGWIPSQCAAGSPVTPVASCPCRALGFQSPPPQRAGRAKPPSQLSSPVIPVALPQALQFPCLSPVRRIRRGMPWCALKHWCYANRNRRITCTLTPSAVSLQTSVKHAEP